MKTDFMQRAIDLATKNVEAARGGPFGAVIVCDGKIIAEGTNLVTTTNDPTAHAEVTAIRAACKHIQNFSLAGCQIYASCEPCPMCMAAIYWARVDQIYYAATKEDAARIGFDDAFFYKEIALPYNKRSIPVEQFLAEAGAKPFQLWENTTSKICY